MYRPQSVRNFKTFIGELTATVAAVHISLYESKSAESKGNSSYWNEASKRHGIVLSGVETQNILTSQSRLSIVSLYSGFDAFCSELKDEQKSFGKEWKKDDKTPPLEILINNANNAIPASQLTKAQKACFNYYRLVRNSVVHPIKKNKDGAEAFYKDHVQELSSIRELYEMKTAPNKPDAVSFHDVKLLCRLLLDITSTFGSAFDPGNAELAKSVPMKAFSKFNDSAQRQENAILGFLKSEYGISSDRALSIAKITLTH